MSKEVRAKGFTAALVFLSALSSASVSAQEMPAPTYYRDMVLRTRKIADFIMAIPGNRPVNIKYKFEWGQAQRMAPEIFRINDSTHPGKFDVNFWDRIFTAADSEFTIDGVDGRESLPLTCLYVSGQDNRFSQKDSPLIPDYVFKVYAVANDFSCTGPLNPGWPYNGKPKDNWETYLYYEIRDPTIMQPTNAVFTYRRNEFNVVLIPSGG